MNHKTGGLPLMSLTEESDSEIFSCDNTGEKWENAISLLDFAFQPIVNIHTGVCYGYEALLRQFQEAGFLSIQEVFEKAFQDNILFSLDLKLREKVLTKFKNIPFHDKMKLFYNIDNRVLLMPDYSPVKIVQTMDKHNLSPGAFCVEVSERHDFKTFLLHDTQNLNGIKNSLNLFKQDLYKIAIDDFGSGLSGLQFLYHTEPDFIKIDRFFISGIAADSRKKLFVSSTLNMAHALGIIVIAEGVETEEEYYTCKEIGCDFVQGYLIQRPSIQLEALREKYEEISELNQKNRRERGTDQKMIHSQILHIEPIPLHSESGMYTDMGTVFDTFRRNKINTFFPITNGNDEPIGIIREKDLKEYVYSPYGKDILKNKSSGNILNFISRLPISEINTRIEKVLELFSMDEHTEGILLTDNGMYIGFLSANSLFKLLNEKYIAEARDQNPLTKLPGNNLINQYISEALEDISNMYVFAYLDFDNFKPFNDTYGFRQGDRAILIFADIIKEISNRRKVFIGHIGGDDFFCAFRTKDISENEIYSILRDIIRNFSDHVMSIYNPADREQGYIIAADREGKEKKYPLLGVRAGVIEISEGQRSFTMEEMFTLLADLKNRAKNSLCHYVTGSMK
jgi:diguanylate cyclase (GGDEF)-like protein